MLLSLGGRFSGRAAGRGLLGLTIILCAGALVPTIASGAPTGSIEGRVTGADTHEGIEGVEVCASGSEAEGDFWFSCETTGSDGTYAIEEVPAGEYEVEFEAGETGYLSQSYFDLVIVEADPVTGIDVELSLGATIEGTAVRSVDEAPVEELEVCAFSIDGEGFAGCTGTDTDGTYELLVPPGEWKIEFWPEWTGQDLALQYFDQHPRWSEADPVLAEEGEVVEGIDARLDPGANITGRVTSEAGSALEEILVCAIDTVTEDLAHCTYTSDSGDYELSFLPAGQYKVAFSLDRDEWFGGESFEDADGFPTQFWNGQATLAAASVISLAGGQEASGIDARLGSSPPSGESAPPVTINVPPAPAPAVSVKASATSSSHGRRKTCRRGLKRKKVKGKYRCVKPKKHHHHRSR